MKYIRLVEDSTAIENTVFKELYLSIRHNIEKTLAYFDRKGIEATVVLRAVPDNDRLTARIEVICEDEVFKKVIEENLKRYRI